MQVMHTVQHLKSCLSILKINIEEIEPDIISLSERKMTEADVNVLNPPPDAPTSQSLQG